MRVVKLLAIVVVALGAWTAYGEAPYELGCIKAYEEKSVTVKVPAYYSPEVAGEGDGNFTLNIAGRLRVEAAEQCFNNLPPFQTYEEMISYVRENYCLTHHRPRGTIFFISPVYPALVRKVPAGYGVINSSSFNLRVGYGDGNREVFLRKYITCQL